MSELNLEALLSAFPGATERESADCPAINVKAAQLVACVARLRDEWQFDFLMDISGVDWGEEADPRFGCHYHLYSTTRHDYIRIYADCVGEILDEPEIPSLCGVWPAANWHERETFDMFGIRFAGHPDLRRILMWDSYPYFPLRKDFPLAGIETELPAPDVAEETGAAVVAAPMMGGPFVAPASEGRFSKAEPRAKDQSWTEKQPQPGQKNN
ncbi:MAG: NADH-quinone oxidoreductase subunit C [Opitutales bacterium]